MTFPICRRFASNILSALMATALLGLAACTTSTAPTRFYTLSSTTPAAQPVHRKAPLLVEIPPVRVPDRLARPQIVVQASGADSAQVRILEHERWASHFNYELHDALVSAITAHLGAVDVSRSGLPTGAAGYRIAIELVQLDAVLDETLQARFSWRIHDLQQRNAVCQLNLTAAAGTGIAGMVQGLQGMLAELAQQIAADVRALEADTSAACASTQS
jgi:uncharacterized lipoprotein YmbA